MLLKRTIATVGVAFLSIAGLAGCSDDKKAEDVVADASGAVADVSEAVSGDTVAATEAATTESAAPDTAAAGGAATEAAPAEAAAGAYTLKEWSLEGSATATAGAQKLSITNGGNFPHEFRILKGTYEEAPKNDLGTVLVKDMPADAQLGLVEKIDPGQTATLDVDLPAGSYLFVCNIEFGPNSHAGKGQRLNVTVA